MIKTAMENNKKQETGIPRDAITLSDDDWGV